MRRPSARPLPPASACSINQSITHDYNESKRGLRTIGLLSIGAGTDVLSVKRATEQMTMTIQKVRVRANMADWQRPSGKPSPETVQGRVEVFARVAESSQVVKVSESESEEAKVGRVHEPL